MRPLVSFLSDFGLKDAYVAQVKAVILSHIPGASIIDITHDIEPFQIISAAWLLSTSWRFFPLGTVHLAVVDPGVGTGRGILAMRKGGHLFIGPDNGIFSFLYPSEEILAITWRPQGALSSTFHGRDIFAPLVVKVLSDHVLSELGIPRTDPVSFDVKAPMVVHIDTFGNVITNIGCDRLGPGTSLVVNGTTVSTVSGTFADIPLGTVGLICGSEGTIEIVANRARASDTIGARVGMMVSIVP
jgi:hypothetical protein